MNDIQSLYQQVILDHNKNPRNYGGIVCPTHTAEGHNPLCGDNIHIDVLMDGDIVDEVKFSGSGCAIAKSSASLMTTIVKGMSREEVERLFREFHSLVTEDGENNEEMLGKLTVFSGVRDFPTRVKCASLAWHTLHAALAGKQDVSTE